MDIAEDLAGVKAALSALHEDFAAERRKVRHLEQALGILQDKDEIRSLQYCYGFFIDNRMFREMADLFANEGAWMEIGGRGRYHGKERIHRFLLEVLGAGRWGLLENEVINHVQQQLVITVDADRQRAHARCRAQVQGNSPPTTETFLLADAVYENEYVREDGKWKILGIGVTMTFYAALERRKIWFETMPPSEAVPPDAPSQPVAAALGRQFSRFHFTHPIEGYPLRVPASAPGARD